MSMLDKTLNTVIMPFRLKLKRTGRYILSYKNSFLIRIHLLDNSIMECTLTMESTGNDCLNAVAQKLELRETKYFGLYYFNKQAKMRWVELDKPLKKQIDKNSQELILYFGVMFYVANIDSLEQEITRYLFYLQLKNNVIDGLLQCTREEAVDLASYILQAEFDDHDPSKHELQFFSDYILFPEALTPNDEHLATLTTQAIDLHKRHRGLRPADAEYNFILKAIHLSGFSEDLHPAKNIFGNDVTVGCSFVGIIIKSRLPDMRKMDPVCHDWHRVECISCSKQTLSLEVVLVESTKDDVKRAFYQFNMEDADTAKYVCRMCDCQRKFYLLNKESTRKLPLEAARSLIRRPTLRRNPEMTGEEMEQPLLTVQASSDYVTTQDSKQAYNADRYYSSQTSLDHTYVSQTSLNHPPPAEPGYVVETRYSNGFGGSVYSSPSINSLSQSHVGRPSPANSNLSINSMQQRGINRGLPHYRPSPDYDVALRHRRRYSSYLESNNPNVIRQTANQQHPSTSVPPPSLKPRPHSMIYSQQELVHQVAHGPQYAHYPQQHPPLYYRRSQPPIDTSQGHISGRIPWDTSHESLSPPGGSQVVDTRLVVTVNGKMTGSTPDLPMQQQQGRPMFVSEMQLHRQFQNHPNEEQAAGSTSTPDLTQQHKENVSASSPDLHLGYNNQPPRPHRPLPPVGSYGEESYSNQQMLVRLVNNQMPTTSENMRVREHKQKRPISSSFDLLENRSLQHQTPEQNVQAYLKHVGESHTNKVYTRPLASSRERLIQQDIYEHQKYSNQQPRKQPLQVSHNKLDRVPIHYDNYTNYQQQTASSFHHAPAPSTATVVVHSDEDDQTTADYLLSQQLQDQALHQVRISRSQEYLDSTSNLPHPNSVHLAGSVNDYLHSATSVNIEEKVASQFRPPPSYPGGFINSTTHSKSIEEIPEPQQAMPEEIPSNSNRGPPPPYHTPSPSLIGQEIVETYAEDNDSDTMESHSDSFQNARRSTIRKMAPLKFAALNGLNVSQRSNSPSKGDPDERVLNLEAKLDDGHVLTEYDGIIQTRLGDYDLESMSSRDRVKEVVPYADCRVFITSTDDNSSGYINASHIKALVSDEEWKYIACQTPLEGYQAEMWDMVWLNNASIIVLLTQEVENGKTRCARYWPNSEGEQDIPCAMFGNYKVLCRFDSNAPPSDDHCNRITRNLVLEKVGSSEKRTIWMLQYVNWPDTGVPKETDDFLSFMKELDSVRRLAVDNELSSLGPVVVQCASGCGRTGVLILTELMVQCLERNQDIEVAEMLTHIRQQRIHFVQTFSQYNFVYKLLIAFLRKSRLI